MKPIRGWPHHIEKIKELLIEHEPKRCVEIGTYCGASAIPIAKTIARWGGRLTCVDIWSNQHDFLECIDNMQNHNVAHRVQIIRATSYLAALAWQDPLDFIYIDADHSYEAVWDDLCCWWPHLKSGGLICGDDYDDPVSPGVKLAWDHFGELIKWKFETHETPGTKPEGLKLVYGVKK